jgi:hypothetical protein
VKRKVIVPGGRSRRTSGIMRQSEADVSERDA